MGHQHDYSYSTHPPSLNNIGAWARNALLPSQQQMPISLNQKTKPDPQPNMGWDYFGATHPYKAKKYPIILLKEKTRQIKTSLTKTNQL